MILDRVRVDAYHGAVEGPDTAPSVSWGPGDLVGRWIRPCCATEATLGNHLTEGPEILKQFSALA